MNPPREVTIDELKEHLEKHKARLERNGISADIGFYAGLCFALDAIDFLQYPDTELDLEN